MKTCRVALLLAAAWTAASALAWAAEKSFQLTVEAGGADRAATPVRVALPGAAGMLSVELKDASGKGLPAQLTAPSLLGNAPQGARELHFVLPALRKGEKIELRAVLSDAAAAAGGFAWKHAENEYAELSLDGRPLLRYVCKPFDPKNVAETCKVFHHVYAPDGSRLITKGDTDGLFPHHRGIFYGFSRITYPGGSTNTWGCGAAGRQTHEGFLVEEAGPVVGRHLVAVGWHGRSQEIFANEKRELTVYRVPGGFLIEFASQLETAGGKVRLDGDPQHAGFHFRAAQEVADGDQKLTYYLRPDGKGEPGQTRNWSPGNDLAANLPWNALSFVIDGRRYTVVYLDHPNNPKEARYSERTYGRFGSYFEYDIDEENPARVRYRLWVQEGEMTVDECAALRADFVEPPKVTVR
jgi:hypothetical protein